MLLQALPLASRYDRLLSSYCTSSMGRGYARTFTRTHALPCLCFFHKSLSPFQSISSSVAAAVVAQFNANALYQAARLAAVVSSSSMESAFVSLQCCTPIHINITASFKGAEHLFSLCSSSGKRISSSIDPWRAFIKLQGVRACVSACVY